MKAKSTLEELDDFLRGAWLECCGHLSDFEIDGITYMVPNLLCVPPPTGITANVT